MKKTIFSILTVVVMSATGLAQNGTDQQLEATVSKLQTAEKARDYIQLAGEFEQIANTDNKNWLAHYYAAFCNAKIGWLYQDDGERIEPFANKAEHHIKAASSLLDTATQKQQLSEIYCVQSMLNKARVFVNPMTQGRKYGPIAYQYLQMARKINPKNPRATYLEAWDKFYAPKMYGGDKGKAKELLQQALGQLNAEQATNNNPQWGKKETEELLSKLK
jgi:hypothetical protein